VCTYSMKFLLIWGNREMIVSIVMGSLLIPWLLIAATHKIFGSALKLSYVYHT